MARVFSAIPSTIPRRVLIMALISVSAFAVTPAGQVVTFGNFIHNVANLEKSAAFYQDALGLELTGPLPIAQRVFASNPPVARSFAKALSKFLTCSTTTVAPGS